MPYSREIFEKSIARLEERRAGAENEQQRLKKILYEKIPRLGQIEKELAQTGIYSAKEILSGTGNAGVKIEQLKKRNLELQAERAEILTACGCQPDILKISYFCSKCNDTGFIGDRICDCLKTLLREESCKKANAGSPLPLCDFDSFSLAYYPENKQIESGISIRQHMSKVFSFCKKYASSFDRNSGSMIFLGQTGLGKTHLALSIANSVISSGFTVIYDTSQNIFLKMEEEYFGRAPKKFSFSAMECDLLIIDDLGSEFNSSFNVSTFYNIINSRILSGRPVIVSANITEEELLSRYSERIFSRLIGDFILLKFFGSDIRQLKLQQKAGLAI